MIVIINVEEESRQACINAIVTASLIGAGAVERGDQQDPEAEGYHWQGAGIYHEKRSGNLKIEWTCLKV